MGFLAVVSIRLLPLDDSLTNLTAMAVWVVEFSNRGYKIRKIFV